MEAKRFYGVCATLKYRNRKQTYVTAYVFRNSGGQQSHVTSRTEEKNETSRDLFN